MIAGKPISESATSTSCALMMRHPDPMLAPVTSAQLGKAVEHDTRHLPYTGRAAFCSTTRGSGLIFNQDESLQRLSGTASPIVAFHHVLYNSRLA
jgi:hypothetical protein